MEIAKLYDCIIQEDWAEANLFIKDHHDCSNVLGSFGLENIKNIVLKVLFSWERTVHAR